MSQNQNNPEYNDDPDNEVDAGSHTSHQLFGSMMKESLIPHDLEVESNYEVGKGPPKLDVLIIRRTETTWSKSQLEFLPDGVRQTRCSHVILELKYTESLTHLSIFQTIGYLGSYAKLKSLKINNVCAFIVSSKTPQKKFLKRIGFESTDIKGVYLRPKDQLLSPIKIISLNDLSDESCNLLIKLFSSKKNQRFLALKNIFSLNYKQFSLGLKSILVKIIYFWKNKGEISMQQVKRDIVDEASELTEEEKAWFISLFKPEDRLRGLKPEERLQGLKPEERLRGLKPEERLRGLKPEVVFNQFKPEDVFKQFKPEDVFKLFKPEDRLKGLDIETIEAFLETTKKQLNIK